jgi:hypothetical protein
MLSVSLLSVTILSVLMLISAIMMGVTNAEDRN